jgi:hypothetical protein
MISCKLYTTSTADHTSATTSTATLTSATSGHTY